VQAAKPAQANSYWRATVDLFTHRPDWTVWVCDGQRSGGDLRRLTAHPHVVVREDGTRIRDSPLDEEM
jgi:hypothetical protein